MARGIKITTQEFINKAQLVHSFKYDYSKTIYLNAHKNVIITCIKHGDFEQKAYSHLNGRGCRKCFFELERTSLIDFINKANIVHCNKYDYSKSIYVNARSPISIICPFHGEFWQIAGTHLSAHGCPFCNSSKGESKIREYLINNKIRFEEQKYFKKCLSIYNKRLLFDFYLPDYNLCIEFDGVQHFVPFSWNSDWSEESKNSNLIYQQQKDNIKTQYCLLNYIDLLRIPYWKINQIDIILKEGLNL